MITVAKVIIKRGKRHAFFVLLPGFFKIEDGKTIFTRRVCAHLPRLLRLYQKPAHQLQGAKHLGHTGICQHAGRRVAPPVAHPHRGRLRPCRPHLPPRGLRTIQGTTGRNARGHPPVCPPHQRHHPRLPHPHPGSAGLRGRRRHRHAGHAGRGAGHRHLHDDPRQGLRPTGGRTRVHVPPALRRQGVRHAGRGGGQGEVRHQLARTNHRPAGPDGRQFGQHPRLSGRGRKDGPETHRRVWQHRQPAGFDRPAERRAEAQGGRKRRADTLLALPGHHQDRRAHRARHGHPQARTARRGRAARAVRRAGVQKPHRPPI